MGVRGEEASSPRLAGRPLARTLVVLVGSDVAPSSANVQDAMERGYLVRPFVLDGVPKVSAVAMPGAGRGLGPRRLPAMLHVILSAWWRPLRGISQHTVTYPRGTQPLP